IVRAAQAAEKRAKNQLGRGAIALTIYKRSGEILEWGARWAERGADGHPTSNETAGYRLFHTLSQALLRGQLNGRFPHKLEALLAPYISKSIEDSPIFEQAFADILRLELDRCLDRNEGGKLSPEEKQLFTAYWQEFAQDPRSCRHKISAQRSAHRNW